MPSLKHSSMDTRLIFETLESNRKRLAAILADTPESVLQEIPEGFNNNIWWNAAHTLVVQQLLCYRLSGLPVYVDEDLVKKYSKGTFPGAIPGAESREHIRQELLRTVSLLEEDFQAGKFKTYREYTTSAGVTLRSIEDGLLFNLYHEGLHMGTVLSLLKVCK